MLSILDSGEQYNKVRGSTALAPRLRLLHRNHRGGVWNSKLAQMPPASPRPDITLAPGRENGQRYKLPE